MSANLSLSIHYTYHSNYCSFFSLQALAFMMWINLTFEMVLTFCNELQLSTMKIILLCKYFDRRSFTSIKAGMKVLKAVCIAVCLCVLFSIGQILQQILFERPIFTILSLCMLAFILGGCSSRQEYEKKVTVILSCLCFNISVAVRIHYINMFIPACEKVTLIHETFTV